MSTTWVIPNCLLVECPLNPSTGGTTTKNPFGQQKELQNKKVVAIESYSNQDVLYSPISSNNQVITQGVFNTSFLTLYRASVPKQVLKNGMEFPASNEGLYYDLIPLSRLRIVGNQNSVPAAATSYGNTMFRVKPAEISWTKSYITCVPSTSIAAPQSALFLVHYLNADENWIPYL